MRTRSWALALVALLTSSDVVVPASALECPVPQPLARPGVLKETPAEIDNAGGMLSSGDAGQQTQAAGHCSGTPALRMASRTGSSPARYVGSSLNAVQSGRARDKVKPGLSARPALTAECASSSRPSCASAAPNTKWGCGLFRLASIARRNHTTAWSQSPR